VGKFFFVVNDNGVIYSYDVNRDSFYLENNSVTLKCMSPIFVKCDSEPSILFRHSDKTEYWLLVVSSGEWQQLKGIDLTKIQPQNCKLCFSSN